MRPLKPGKGDAPRHSLVALVCDLGKIIAASTHLLDRKNERQQVIRLSGPLRYRPSPKVIRRISFACAAVIASRPVVAQSVHRDATPETLFEPERGTGIAIASSFRLQPSLDVDGDWDSNVYNVDDGKQSDMVMRIRPEVVLASDFSRHSLELATGGEIRRFADVSDENAESYHADAKALLELGGRIDVTAKAGYEHGFEQRGTAGDQFSTDKPVEYDRYTAAAGISRFRPKLGLALDGQVTSLRYDDTTVGGTPVSLDNRDFDRKLLRFRTSYRLREALNIFAQAGLNTMDYRTAIASERDSDGISLLAGVQLKPSAALDFEAAAGYLEQNFDSAAYDKVSEVNYMLAANWLPRRSWRVRAEVSRDVDASPRSDAAAIVRSEFKLGVRHSLGERMLLELNGATVRENYRGIDRLDRFHRVGLRARYRINGNAGVTAHVGYRKQDGGRDYSGLGAGLGLRLVF